MIYLFIYPLSCYDRAAQDFSLQVLDQRKKTMTYIGKINFWIKCIKKKFVLYPKGWGENPSRFWKYGGISTYQAAESMVGNLPIKLLKVWWEIYLSSCWKDGRKGRVSSAPPHSIFQVRVSFHLAPEPGSRGAWPLLSFKITNLKIWNL